MLTLFNVSSVLRELFPSYSYSCFFTLILCLLAVLCTCGRYCLCSCDKLSFPPFDLPLSPLPPNIFFCFSDHQEVAFFLLLFLSSQSCVLQLAFVHRICFKVSSSLLYIQELFHLLSSLTILSSNTSAPISLLSRSLSHINQCLNITPNQFLPEFIV